MFNVRLAADHLYGKWLFTSLSLGWSGGAKMLSKPSVPGRPIYLDNRRARAYRTCSMCGWGLVWTFFLSSIIQGIILNHFVPPKTTVTGNYYATVIKSELVAGD